jgi:uncharacterized membrane protein YhhN
VLIASIIAGVSYVATWSLHLPQADRADLERRWASACSRSTPRSRREVAGRLAAGRGDGVRRAGRRAAGDAAGLTVGALAFLVGHLVAIGLYLRNRPNPFCQLALARHRARVVIIAYLLPADRAGAPGVALYSLVPVADGRHGLMSRFHRFRVGLGAVMFVVSDLLIFARAGPLPDSFAGLAVWGLYYFGQLLICVGVVQGPVV